jgi:hypothetical protein
VATTKKNKGVYIVRHLVDSEIDKVSQVGPFHNEEEALNTCVHFLKNGTCSWLVKHNG